MLVVEDVVCIRLSTTARAKQLKNEFIFSRFGLYQVSLLAKGRAREHYTTRRIREN